MVDYLAPQNLSKLESLVVSNKASWGLSIIAAAKRGADLTRLHVVAVLIQQANDLFGLFINPTFTLVQRRNVLAALLLLLDTRVESVMPLNVLALRELDVLHNGNQVRWQDVIGLTQHIINTVNSMNLVTQEQLTAALDGFSGGDLIRGGVANPLYFSPSTRDLLY